jgi:hypothetical protein
MVIVTRAKGIWRPSKGEGKGGGAVARLPAMAWRRAAVWCTVRRRMEVAVALDQHEEREEGKGGRVGQWPLIRIVHVEESRSTSFPV